MTELDGAVLPFLVPLVYLAAAVLPVSSGLPGARWRLGQRAAGAALALAVAAAAWWAVAGPAVWRVPGLPLGPLGMLTASVRLDAPTVVMLLLVTVIAAAIVRFSRRYLDGEPGAPAYPRWFLATLGAASIVVVTNNLLVLALAWTAASLALHRLLTFFPDRPQAIVAAHKKFLLSRLADAAILLSVTLVGWTFGTLEIDQVLARAAALPELPGAVTGAGLLLATGVILRSAQLPFHGWLIQVMEAPTPVSALLHAGIVNLGGFVLIRLGALVGRIEAGQWALVAAGTLTAVLAGLVMTTRVSVKVSLAWSTAAQMGFMLVECGLGAYGLALLHLVAHSLYKAHAFLASGRTVEQTVRRDRAPAGGCPGVGTWLAAGLASGLVVAGVAAALGVAPADDPTATVFGLLLALALAPLFVRAWGIPGRRPLADALLVAIGVSVLYAGGHHLFAGLVPGVPRIAAPGLRIAMVLAGFGVLFAIQAAVAARPGGALARRLYPACFAGFYLDEVFTRWTFALWPPTAARVRTVPPPRRAVQSLESAA